MNVKYYMQFLLHEAEAGSSHYSGVVEVDRVIQNPHAIDEIEEMLADNFEVDSDDVRLIHWGRLH